MLKYLVGFVLSVIAVSAGRAQVTLERDVPFGDLTGAEIRFLQAAMTAADTYDGPLDGEWNDAGRNALNALVRARFDAQRPQMTHIARLAREFSEMLANERWQPVYSEAARISFQLPAAFVQRMQQGDGMAFAGRGGALRIRTLATPPGAAAQLHERVRRDAADPGRVYARRQDALQITSSRLVGGVSAYVRTDRVPGGSATTVLEWEPERQRAARLIAASIRPGRQAGLGLAPSGVLRRAIGTFERWEARRERSLAPKPAPETAKAEATPRPEGKAKAKAKPGSDRPRRNRGAKAKNRKARFAGTGFYINGTDILTAVAVLEACKNGLELTDGAVLRPVADARGGGAVLLSSPARSPQWLALDSGAAADGDGFVTAMGYPAYPEYAPDLIAAKGRLGDEMATGPRGRRVLLGPAQRRGTTGAPVFGRDGRIVGMVIAPRDDERASPKDRTALVASVAALAELLDRNRILRDLSAPGTAGKTAGPEPDAAAARAIVALFCH